MADKNPLISCKDFLVSGEEFGLYKHPEFEILETRPVPENLSAYYESEEYISHTDSSKNFTDKIYGVVKDHMLKKKIGWIEKEKSTGKILDIGAGTGDFLLQAKKSGWEVSGIEPNISARRRAEEKGLSLQENSSSCRKESYDVITMWHVLEHVPDLDSQINELRHLLKKDGILVIAVPNFKSADAKHYGKFWAAFDVPRHLWHFSQEGISMLFAKHNFQLQKFTGLKFDSYYVSLLSEKYKSGKKNFIKALLWGWKSNLEARKTTEYSSLVYFFRKNE